MALHSQLRILVLGHSFVWRPAKFTMESNLPCIAPNFHCAEPSVIQFYGIGGRTVTKLRQFDLSPVAQFNPIHIIVSQVLPRRSPPGMMPSYNTRVTPLTHLANHFLRVTPFATLWFHPKSLRTQPHIFLRDRVHPNFIGNHFLYHSYQKDIM